jgi:hypothetical protein
LYQLKIDDMKSALFLILVFLSCSIYSQSELKEPKLKEILTASTWKSDKNLFSDEGIDRYSIFKDAKDEFYSWGNSVTFTDSKFNTNYSAPCGNDCFTSVNGTYKFVGSNKIKVFVNDISRSGFCQDKSESPKKSFGIFQINKTDEGYEIVKVN